MATTVDNLDSNAEKSDLSEFKKKTNRFAGLVSCMNYRYVTTFYPVQLLWKHP